jgi:hypothetical protein
MRPQTVELFAYLLIRRHQRVHRVRSVVAGRPPTEMTEKGLQVMGVDPSDVVTEASTAKNSLRLKS